MYLIDLFALKVCLYASHLGYLTDSITNIEHACKYEKLRNKEYTPDVRKGMELAGQGRI